VSEVVTTPSEQENLDIQDYLEAASHAAKRTRSACIVVVVASVLVFAGLLNSLQNAWLLERIRISNADKSKYVADRIGAIPQAKSLNGLEMHLYEIRYREFYSALSRTYAENSYVIRVPFFGVSVDVNDLGLLGGISFVIALIMLRLCLSREVGNLRLSFAEAKTMGRLAEFYKLLAMQQVFTVPRGTVKRDLLFTWVPRVFFVMPTVVHAAVVVHDLATLEIGQLLSSLHTMIVLSCEIVIFLMILALTVMVLVRLKRLNTVWSDYYDEAGFVPKDLGGA